MLVQYNCAYGPLFAPNVVKKNIWSKINHPRHFNFCNINLLGLYMPLSKRHKYKISVFIGLMLHIVLYSYTQNVIALYMVKLFFILFARLSGYGYLYKRAEIFKCCCVWTIILIICMCSEIYMCILQQLQIYPVFLIVGMFITG